MQYMCMNVSNVCSFIIPPGLLALSVPHLYFTRKVGISWVNMHTVQTYIYRMRAVCLYVQYVCYQ